MADRRRDDPGGDGPEGRLAGAGGAHDREPLAGLDPQLDAIEDRVAVDIGVADAGEYEGSWSPGWLDAGLRWLRHQGDTCETGERGAGGLDAVEGREDGADGVEETVEEEGCGRDRADGALAGAHEHEAGGEHEGQADELRPVGPGEKPGEHVEDLDGDPPGFVRAALDTADLLDLEAVRPQRRGPLQARDERLRALALRDPLAGVIGLGAGRYQRRPAM